MIAAQKVSKELGLVKQDVSVAYFSQNEISNDDLITELQERSLHIYVSGVFGDGKAELFLFSDNSCIRRFADKYFIIDDVETLSEYYLKTIGYE
jgi:hypothetical protein